MENKKLKEIYILIAVNNGRTFEMLGYTYKIEHNQLYFKSRHLKHWFEDDIKLWSETSLYILKETLENLGGM
jgi:hypothetical protein